MLVETDIDLCHNGTMEKGSLKRFFASPKDAKAQNPLTRQIGDSDESVDNGNKRRKIQAPLNASGKVKAEWLAADERNQIEQAIKLSLQEQSDQKAGTRTATPGEAVYVDSKCPIETAPGPVDAKPETPSDVEVVSEPKVEIEDSKNSLHGVFANKTTDASVAPLFKGKQTERATVVSRPTLNKDDFEPISAAVVLNRLEGSLNCLFWSRWMSSSARESLRQWMLSELAWHRVSYIRPGGIRINTPRFTTTFGIDDTKQPPSAYQVKPKPIPPTLLELKSRIEEMQNNDPSVQTEDGQPVRYNALIINYYSNGDDSISYHSDDEAFLGVNPNIASLSLGAARDFYLRRKAPAGTVVPKATSASGSKGSGPAASRPTEKMQLLDGSLLIMKGKTQAEWEHSIPKRKNLNQGRINITFRRAITHKAINNFITYNRGKGPTYRWRGGQMVEGSGGI
ncbi:unnamed protein product [Sympodiomycopsis kandeliae]